MSNKGLPDSGQRHTFDTGAVREPPVGKGRYDLVPHDGLHRLAVHYENGARKYADRNWEKGLPFSNYVGAIYRHLGKYVEGDRSEDHLAAVAWNAFGLMHHEKKIEQGKLPSRLNDLPKPPSRVDSDEEILLLAQLLEKYSHVPFLDIVRSGGIDLSVEQAHAAVEHMRAHCPAASVINTFSGVKPSIAEDMRAEATDVEEVIFEHEAKPAALRGEDTGSGDGSSPTPTLDEAPDRE